MIAPANPLRGVTVDAAYIASCREPDPGPVLLVGHSYGGAVITNAGVAGRQRASVWSMSPAFIPDEGETCWHPAELADRQRAPPALRPTPVSDAGATEPHDRVHHRPGPFHDVFCADLPAERRPILAVTQRPLSGSPSASRSVTRPGRRFPPGRWSPTGDMIIGRRRRALHGRARRRHDHRGRRLARVMISQPQAVADVILTAVNAGRVEGGAA